MGTKNEPKVRSEHAATDIAFLLDQANASLALPEVFTKGLAHAKILEARSVLLEAQRLMQGEHGEHFLDREEVEMAQ